MSGRSFSGCRSPCRLHSPRPPAAPTARGRPLALRALLNGLLAGCAWFRSPLIKADRIDLIATPRTNDNSPVAVDIVAVYAAAVLQKLAGVSRVARLAAAIECAVWPGARVGAGTV